MTCESAPGMRRDNAAPSQQTPRKLKDRFDNGIDLVFQLDSKAGAARLVIVDHVIDLDDREPMDSKLQPLARAALRLRMWARYSSRVIVSAASRSTSAPRRWILELIKPATRRQPPDDDALGSHAPLHSEQRKPM